MEFSAETIAIFVIEDQRKIEYRMSVGYAIGDRLYYMQPFVAVLPITGRAMAREQERGLRAMGRLRSGSIEGVMMDFWEWFTFAGTLAGILALSSLWSDRRTSKLLAEMHTATQSTMADMSKGFRDSQQVLGQQMAESTRELAHVLERMDQRADERHREVLNTLEALRRP
jgi:hypothetical protein